MVKRPSVRPSVRLSVRPSVNISHKSLLLAQLSTDYGSVYFV